MKKKIKDLTLEDIIKYCDDRKVCQGCPFGEDDICFGGLIDSQKEYFLNQEIEVNSDEEKD